MNREVAIAAPRPQVSLTPRNCAALAQLVMGASSKEAARALGISPRTVEFHCANIMQKLSAKNTVEIVHKVLRRD